LPERSQFDRPRPNFDGQNAAENCFSKAFSEAAFVKRILIRGPRDSPLTAPMPGVG